MRLSRVRFTVRRMMAAVAVSGLAFYLLLTALRVHTDVRSSWLYHLWERHAIEGYETVFNAQHPAPFWPRYWWKLLGQPWPGTYVCDESCARSWEKVGRVVFTVPMNPSPRRSRTADAWTRTTMPSSPSTNTTGSCVSARIV
jgi:hypothetical protein